MGIDLRLGHSIRRWTLRFAGNATRHRDLNGLRALYELARDAPVLYADLGKAGVEIYSAGLLVRGHEESPLALCPGDDRAAGFHWLDHSVGAQTHEWKHTKRDGP